MIHKDRVPIDDKWHEYRIGPVVAVGHQDLNYVTFWYDTAPPVSGINSPRIFLRVYGTGQETPEGAAWLGTSLGDPRGFVWHVFWTDNLPGVPPDPRPHKGDPPPPRRKGL